MTKQFVVTVSDEDMRDWREEMAADGYINAVVLDEDAILQIANYQGLLCTVQELKSE